jgi:ATP-dependent helicase/nuclease subunit B
VYAQLIERLAAGATVVTPNRRLAAGVRRAFDRAQIRAGRALWAAADVLPWSAWLERSWQQWLLRAPIEQAQRLPLLLGADQEQALWLRALGESPEADGLLQLESAADTSREAWAIAHGFRLLPALSHGPVNDDCRAFLRWAQAYDRACAEAGWLDPARLPDRLADAFRSGTLPAPPRLILAGFDTLTPQQHDLVSTLGALGTRVEQLAALDRPAHALVRSLPGVRDEIRAAARWARAVLERNPDASIGVVVPGLSRLRADLLRIFEEVLAPDALAAGTARALPFNISLGLPLSEWPVVRAALLLLELASGRLSLDAAGWLLRSPFLGEAESERYARALLDARLRRLGEPFVDLAALSWEAGQEGRRDACGLLASRLEAMRRQVRDVRNERLSPSAWGPVLQAVLAAAGWPAQRPLDSAEYQSAAKWRELIAGLARLDAVSGPHTLKQAVTLLRRLAGEQLFQPETPAVPIQILGLLESAWLEFDHLWVMGLHDEAWPRAARPNPLLPAELQRRNGVPGASAEWELRFARGMTDGWMRAAPEVVLSFPAGEQDRELIASPLLANLARVEPDDTRSRSHRDLLFAARSHELFSDFQADALPSGVAFRGGARLLRDQAACPFRAFAAHRLGAKGLDRPLDGLSAGERGDLLHRALALVWSDLSSQARLNSLSESERSALIVRCVGQALERMRRRRPSVFQERFLALEQHRLESLIREWLSAEQARGAFAVAGCEQERIVEVGALRLQLRLDRVDRLESGGLLLLDYKTGEAKTAHWFDARPDDPQLPLYTLAVEEPVAALAFGQVRAGACALVGLADRPGAAEQVRAFPPVRFAGGSATWSAQLEEWRRVLAGLAEAFRRGDAAVDPKRYPETCEHCELGTLCRVRELRARRALTELEEEADE